MTTKISHGVLLTALAIIFTIGLTFASVELPRVADRLLSKSFNFPDVITGYDAESEYRTEVYFDHYHLRLIGYGCLAIVVLLIVTGFITNRSRVSTAGAIFLFLPVFGHFALTMFFLGGLGFMRLVWMPFLDVSFGIMRLGDIVNLPYRILLDGGELIGVNIWRELPYVVTGLGLLIFMLGTLTWFYARVQKKGVADFWVYRLSRHPQYLGWIIWSYGILFLPSPNIKKMFDISNGLPWLLMTMIIIGVAMLEELRMKKERGEEYESYRRRAPFLFPLPRFVSRIFAAPLWLFCRKWRAERKREIVAMLAFYTLVLIGLSLFYGGFISLKGKADYASAQRIEKLAAVVREADNRGEKRTAAAALAGIGEPAVEAMIALLKDDDLYVRWYTANVIGSIKSEKAVGPLIELLHDEDRNVRGAAARALGAMASAQAIEPLIAALRDPASDIFKDAMGALGRIGAQEAVEPLIAALFDTTLNAAGPAAEALGNIGSPEAVTALHKCLDEMKDCPFLEVGRALQRAGSGRCVDAFIFGLSDERWWMRNASITSLAAIGSERAIEAVIGTLQDPDAKVRRVAVLALKELPSEKVMAALTRALDDEDFEVRMYAGDALKTLAAPKSEKVQRSK